MVDVKGAPKLGRMERLVDVHSEENGVSPPRPTGELPSACHPRHGAVERRRGQTHEAAAGMGGEEAPLMAVDPDRGPEAVEEEGAHMPIAGSILPYVLSQRTLSCASHHLLGGRMGVLAAWAQVGSKNFA